MNNQIKRLNERLIALNCDAETIQCELQVAWNGIFADLPILRDAVTKLENSTDYTFDQYGEIVSWIRFDLSDFQDNKQYLIEYMREYNFVEVNFVDDCLTYSQGPDCITIQDDTRRDNGVWLNSKLIIEESDYKTEDGEVDETKRNQLIEEYMNRVGEFPGVFRTDSYGNVSFVDTKV